MSEGRGGGAKGDVQGAVHAVYDNCQVFLFEQINGFEKFVLGHL
jgi:hypothetical protein